MHIVDKAQLDSVLEALGPEPMRSRLMPFKEPSEVESARMMLVFKPATYVRPHSHPGQSELFICVWGSARVLTFSPEGTITDSVEMSRDKAVAVELPQNACHGLLAHDRNTVLFLVKPGANKPSEFASWSPTYAEPQQAAAFVKWLSTAEIGDRWSPNTPLDGSRSEDRRKGYIGV